MRCTEVPPGVCTAASLSFSLFFSLSRPSCESRKQGTGCIRALATALESSARKIKPSFIASRLDDRALFIARQALRTHPPPKPRRRISPTKSCFVVTRALGPRLPLVRKQRESQLLATITVSPCKMPAERLNIVVISYRCSLCGL